jgi:molybdate transport system ATP-binding protein
VLTGRAEAGVDGLTRVALDGGGSVVSTDRVHGPVAVCVFPWEIAIEPPGAPPGERSALNRLDAEVLTTTEIGNRVRLGLAAPQPLAAEVTLASTRSLALHTGARVTATWKATATRLVET